FQVAGQRASPAPGRYGLLGAHLPQCAQGGGGVERRAAREQLVQDGAQGVNVGSRTNLLRLPRRLFRRHVARRAEQRLTPARADVGIQDLGQTEIGDLRRAVGRQQDVVRL